MKLLILALLPVAAFGFIWQPGVTGSTFLRLGVGVRPVAMGGAYTAVADDGNGLFWNPAGMGMTKNFQANFMTMDLLQFTNYSGGGMVIPLSRSFGLGFGGSLFSASDIRRDETGKDIGSFSLWDFAASGGLAFKPYENLSIGSAAKVLVSRIDRYSSYTAAVDVGVIYSPSPYLYLGSTLLNVGPPRRFIDSWEPLPTNLRTGLAIKIPLAKNHLLVASDLSVYPDADPTLSIGGEFYLWLGEGVQKALAEPFSALTLWAGYKSGYHYLGSWSGFSVGLGYEYQIGGGFYLAIDALYLSYGYLGGSERLSVSLRYEPTTKTQSRRRHVR
jgi:hypothetical protein